MKQTLFNFPKFIKFVELLKIGTLLANTVKNYNMKFFRTLLIPVLLLVTVNIFAQDEEPAAPSKPAMDMPKLKKKEDTKITEVINTDSVSASELLKRAVNFVKLESIKYSKTNGVTTGSKAEFTANFPVKPKSLNPETDYTGKLSMKVAVECKDNKYRYTITQLKHISLNGRTSGGSIDNEVPECGSMGMSDVTWKKLKGEMLKGANVVLADLKEAMQKSSDEGNKDEW
jgi:hypothetical protein